MRLLRTEVSGRPMSFVPTNIIAVGCQADLMALIFTADGEYFESSEAYETVVANLGICMDRGPSNWMPLPEPPKEG